MAETETDTETENVTTFERLVLDWRLAEQAWLAAADRKQRAEERVRIALLRAGPSTALAASGRTYFLLDGKICWFLLADGAEPVPVPDPGPAGPPGPRHGERVGPAPAEAVADGTESP